MGQQANARRKERREKWLEENGPCAICRGTRQLEVDHIDPRSKTHRVRDIWVLGEPKRRELLAHCQVLCRRCHTIKTAEDRGYTLIPAATIRRLWQLRGLGLGEVGLSRELGISKWQARAILAGAAYSKYRY